MIDRIAFYAVSEIFQLWLDERISLCQQPKQLLKMLSSMSFITFLNKINRLELGAYWTYAVYIELQITHDTETGL